MYSYTYHSLWVVLDLHGDLETIYYFLEPPASSITKPGCRDDVDDRLLQITCSNLLVTCTWMCCVFVSKKDWPPPFTGHYNVDGKLLQMALYNRSID